MYRHTRQISWSCSLWVVFQGCFSELLPLYLATRRSQGLCSKSQKSISSVFQAKTACLFQVKLSELQPAASSRHLVSFKHNSFSSPLLSACFTEVFLSVKITGPAFKSTPLLSLLSVPFPPIKALKVQRYACLLRRLLISVSAGWLGFFFYR